MNLEVNISNWKLRQYRDFMKATQTGDFDVILETLSRLIVSWDFAGDPKNLDYWLDELSILDWQNILNKFMEVMQQKFAVKN